MKWNNRNTSLDHGSMDRATTAKGKSQVLILMASIIIFFFSHLIFLKTFNNRIGG